MVHRGHRYQDLVDLYPLRLVLYLHQAANLNRLVELVGVANAMSAAVSNSLDLGFGGGKGKILERFAEIMMQPGTPKKKPKPVMTERAAAYFASLAEDSSQVKHG